MDYLRCVSTDHVWQIIPEQSWCPPNRPFWLLAVVCTRCWWHRKQVSPPLDYDFPQKPEDCDHKPFTYFTYERGGPLEHNAGVFCEQCGQQKPDEDGEREGE